MRYLLIFLVLLGCSTATQPNFIQILSPDDYSLFAYDEIITVNFAGVNIDEWEVESTTPPTYYEVANNHKFYISFTGVRSSTITIHATFDDNTTEDVDITVWLKP